MQETSGPEIPTICPDEGALAECTTASSSAAVSTAARALRQESKTALPR